MKWKMPPFPTTSDRQFTGKGWKLIDREANARWLLAKQDELQQRLEAHQEC